MKKTWALAWILALFLGLTACQDKPVPQKVTLPTQQASEAVSPAGSVVGVCIPDNTERWKTDVEVLTRELQSLGYEVAVEYAAGDPATQIYQVDKLVEQKVCCLVVAPVDSLALVETQNKAEDAGIPVIAYDRLLMDAPGVDAFVTFDYVKMGQEMGSYIVQQKLLDTAAAEQRSYTIEFYMGSADDNSAFLLHTGILSVLQPYLDAGVLVCASGRTSFADTYVLQASPVKAAEKLSNCLSSAYGERPLDIICFGTDEMAVDCVELLASFGYDSENQPLIVSQGGSLVGANAVLQGRIAMTVYKDNVELAQNAARIANALITRQTPEYNDAGQFHNHVVTVPAWVCPAFPVDSTTCWSLLVETGVYSESDFT